MRRFSFPAKSCSWGRERVNHVRKGQVLARIDPTDFTLSVKGAAAQVASAQAALEKAMHSARPELLEQARIGYERAEDEYRRMKMLYDSKSLAPNDFQKFKAAYEHAKQEYEQAKAGGQKEDKAWRRRVTTSLPRTLRLPGKRCPMRRCAHP